MTFQVNLLVRSDAYHILKHGNFTPYFYPYMYCHVVDTKETERGTISIAVLTERHLSVDTRLDAYIVDAFCLGNNETILCVLSDQGVRDWSHEIKECVQWVLAAGNDSAARNREYAKNLYTRYCTEHILS